jgi:hypothetical protein
MDISNSSAELILSELTRTLEDHHEEPDTDAGLALPHDLASSQLQKALRRKLKKTALIAAKRLLSENTEYFWRRFTGICFEDFGPSHLSLTRTVVAVARARNWRGQVGDLKIASFLIAELMLTPADRRVDDLYMLAVAAREFPLYRSVVLEDADARNLLQQAIQAVSDCERLVPSRYVRGLLPKKVDGWIDALDRLEPSLKALCQEGRKASACILPLVMALYLNKLAPSELILNTDELTTEVEGNIVLAAIDGYTAAGRQILTGLVSQPRWKRLLRSVEGTSPQKALAMLLFAAEGGRLRSYLTDPIASELGRFAQACWSGLPPDQVPEAIALLTQSLPEINQRRRETLAISQN